MSLPIVGAEVGSPATVLDRVTAQTPIVTALGVVLPGEDDVTNPGPRLLARSWV